MYGTKLSGCPRQAHRGWQFESPVKDDAAKRTTEIICAVTEMTGLQ